jgi:hypothetical protein
MNVSIIVRCGLDQDTSFHYSFNIMLGIQKKKGQPPKADPAAASLETFASAFS